MKMEGHIIVTNKRILLHGTQTSLAKMSKTNWINDIDINDVMGADVFFMNERSLASIIFGIISKQSPLIIWIL